MHIEPERHRTPFISLTPLIDVVFILLVFFMLATRFGQFYDLPVNVQPAESMNKPDDKWLVIEVEADGDLNLNGVSFTLTPWRIGSTPRKPRSGSPSVRMPPCSKPWPPWMRSRAPA